MHTTFDEMSRFDPTNQIDAVMSRRAVALAQRAGDAITPRDSIALDFQRRPAVSRFRVALLLAALGAGQLAAVTPTSSMKDQEQSPTTISKAPVQFTVVDAETGKPVACCIYLTDAAGNHVQPANLPFWRDHFACAGVAKLDLPFGVYTYEIDRGPEYFLTTGTLLISANSAPAVTYQIRRMVNMANAGWWSGELHIHRAMEDIELLMQAADLHVGPVITWWNAQNVWDRHPLPSRPLVRFDRDRFCHLMSGEDERGGGAVLFFNLGQPLPITGATQEYPSSMEFIVQARQHQGVWIDIEKPFWYDTPVWLASGMVDSIGIANNHMQRGGVVPTEAWGRPRDQRRYPNPQGNGYWAQEIYYQILNCGLRLPPSGGSASGVLTNPVGYNRLYVHLDGEPSYEEWWKGFKAGRVFVSNGPMLRCQANGELPGHIFKAAAGQSLTVDLNAVIESRDPVSAIEVIQNGQVVSSMPCPTGNRTGSLGSVTFTESGWFLVRVMADVPNTFRFASTGPFYVEVGPAVRRVSQASARFFVDWVKERMGQIRLDDPRKQAEVIKYHQQAEQFWRQVVEKANAP